MADRATINGVQILRGLAALAVVFFHALIETRPLLSGTVPHALLLVGAAGVDNFFVISGFIMVYTTWNRSATGLTGKDFIRRRVIRIVPLYWICTTLALALWATGRFFRGNTYDAYHIVASYLFIPSGTPIWAGGWTLVFEMYFYVFFALAFAARTLKRSIVFVSALLLTIIVTARFAFSDPLPEEGFREFFGNPIALEFVYGMILGFLFRTDRLPQLPASIIVGAAALIIIAAGFAPSKGSGGLDPSLRFLAWGLPSAIIVAAAVRWQPKEEGWLSRSLLTVGAASYSIYLTHPFVIAAYASLVKRAPALMDGLPPLAWLSLTIVLAVCAGLLSYIAIEAPLNRALNRKTEPLRPLSKAWPA